MKKRNIRLILSFLLVTALVLSSCGPAVEGEQEEEEEATIQTADVWLDLLQLVPFIPNAIEFGGVLINDFHMLRGALGIPLPAPDASSEELSDHWMNLLGFEGKPNYLSPHVLSGLDARSLGDAEEWQQTLGFTWADVDQTLYAGVPPNAFQAVRGRFERNTIDQAVKSGPMNDLLEDITYKGIEYYSWGGDNELMLSRTSGVRPLGRGHRMALVDDSILWHTTTDGLEIMVDCYQGNFPSLATIEEFQLLAQGLTELGTYTAFFRIDPQALETMSQLLSMDLESTGKTEDEI